MIKNYITMGLFEMRLILLSEKLRMGVLNCVKYFGIFDSIMPMIPMLFDFLK